jgi:hypothetical protein
MSRNNAILLLLSILVLAVAAAVIWTAPGDGVEAPRVEKAPTAFEPNDAGKRESMKIAADSEAVPGLRNEMTSPPSADPASSGDDLPDLPGIEEDRLEKARKYPRLWDSYYGGNYPFTGNEGDLPDALPALTVDDVLSSEEYRDEAERLSKLQTLQLEALLDRYGRNDRRLRERILEREEEIVQEMIKNGQYREYPRAPGDPTVGGSSRTVKDGVARFGRRSEEALRLFDVFEAYYPDYFELHAAFEKLYRERESAIRKFFEGVK